MEPRHDLEGLFRQLGLAGDPAGIDRFIADHRPLDPGTALADASFWTPAQAGFLTEEVERDADWAELIDHLSAMLRA